MICTKEEEEEASKQVSTMCKGATKQRAQNEAPGRRRPGIMYTRKYIHKHTSTLEQWTRWSRFQKAALPVVNIEQCNRKHNKGAPSMTTAS